MADEEKRIRCVTIHKAYRKSARATNWKAEAGYTCKVSQLSQISVDEFDPAFEELEKGYENDDAYLFTFCLMTQAELDALPEFDGW